MAAALVLPVSGPYTTTWDGFSLGTQNDDGFVLMSNYTGQEINATDAFGMTLVEAIFRGINWRLRFRGMEFNRPGILASMQTFGFSGPLLGEATRFQPNIGSIASPTIGDRYSRQSAVMFMENVLPVQPQGGLFGTSSNPGFIASITASSAVVSPNSNFEYLFTSKVREAPFEFVLLPFTATIGGVLTNLAFTTT